MLTMHIPKIWERKYWMFDHLHLSYVREQDQPYLDILCEKKDQNWMDNVDKPKSKLVVLFFQSICNYDSISLSLVAVLNTTKRVVLSIGCNRQQLSAYN